MNPLNGEGVGGWVNIRLPDKQTTHSEGGKQLYIA